jgi:dUTP pyrophosphatase
MVPVDNISNEDYIIKRGERLFQIVHPSLEPINVQLVEELSESERGSGGFGSTGK